MVPLQEGVEVGAVAVGDPGRLGDVALGHLKECDQVVLLEALPGLGEGGLGGERPPNGNRQQ